MKNENLNINKGNEHPEGVQNKNKLRYWVDLDGTCAYYPDMAEDWWKIPGIFRYLAPQEKVIKAVKRLIANGADVYILSAYNEEFPEAKEDKIYWVKKYLPEIPLDHQIYTIAGQNKADFIPGGIKITDVLLDDYNKNLTLWQNSGGLGIKLLNGLNDPKSWSGISVKANGTIKEIVNVLTYVEQDLEKKQ